MASLSYIDRYDFPEKSYALKFADVCLTPLRISLGGEHFGSDQVNRSEAKVHSLAVRIFAGMTALVLFPLMLGALAVKWIKCDEWQNIDIDLADEDPEENSIPQDELSQEEETQPSPSLTADLTKDEFHQTLKEDLSRVHHLDVKFGSPEKGTWRKHGEKCGEYNQTLDAYLKNRTAEWPDRRPLVIQLIGSFDKIDRKIIAITIDFLKQFHQIHIRLEKDVKTMDELKADYLQAVQENRKQRDDEFQEMIQEFAHDKAENSFPRPDGQYESDFALNILGETLLPEIEAAAGQKCNLIAFTSADLFGSDMQNFVFGSASLYQGVGIWSNARFGNPRESSATFEKCLLRMMKISAHEFGHMRAIPHCTDYECNIGGYMSAQELDRRPLFYCLQDTAKICSLGQTNLLNYHQNLLKFFQGFNKKYDLHCDLSKELDTLQERIAQLNSV